MIFRFSISFQKMETHNNLLYGYIAGSLNGLSQVVSGHPLDTVKVYMQTQGKYDIGYRHLWRGIMYPLITIVPITALQFGTENVIQKIMNKQEKDFSAMDGFISGGLTGLVCVPVISITELYRIRRQKFGTAKNVPKTLGMGLTVMREIPAVATYFGVYKYLSEKLKDLDDYSRPLISGGAGGGLSWFVNYPVDVVKTRIQSGESNSIMEALRLGRLYKGALICTLRGTLVNGVGFLTYEKAMKTLTV